MKLIIQKVSSANVIINKQEERSISNGYLVYLGISKQCSYDKIKWCCKKLLSLRVFEKSNRGFQQSIEDVKGDILIISQFTLFAECKEGTKPNCKNAANYEEANYWYELLLEELQKQSSLKIKSGKFGAHMDIESINDGPLTFIVER